jgi:hypothetical protein
VPAHAFVSARLKTIAQAAQEITTESTELFSQRQLIDHYRSEIATDQAREVFFQKKHT